MTLQQSAGALSGEGQSSPMDHTGARFDKAEPSSDKVESSLDSRIELADGAQGCSVPHQCVDAEAVKLEASSATADGAAVSPFKWRLFNIFLCSAGWCCGISAFFIQVTISTLAVRELAGDTMATVPLGAMLAGACVCTMPVSFAMQRFGKKPVLVIAALIGLSGAFLMLGGILTAKASLLVAGSVPQGLAFTAAFNYRFLSVEFAEPSFKSKALSMTVGGAVISPFVGPQLAKQAKHLFPVSYAGSYMVVIVIYAVQACVAASIQMGLRLPSGSKGGNGGGPEEEEDSALSRRDRLIKTLTSPGLVFPALVASTAYSAMAALMGATPLGMLEYGLSESQSTIAIQSHILGMFVPSLFSGDLVKAIGAHRMMPLGGSILMLGNGVYWIGTHFAVFASAITLVGVGWNLAFVSASSLIATACHPSDGSIVQGVTDQLTFLMMSAVVLTAGLAFDVLGWNRFLGVYMCVNVVCTLLGAGYFFIDMRQRRQQPGKVEAAAAMTMSSGDDELGASALSPPDSDTVKGNNGAPFCLTDCFATSAPMNILSEEPSYIARRTCLKHAVLLLT